MKSRPMRQQRQRHTTRRGSNRPKNTLFHKIGYNRHKPLAGFTIIEVLIVLAIAGLIMLIIFLVVPTLQKHSRNYDRKNYVGLIYSSLNDYYNANGHYPGASGNPSDPANQAEICGFLQSLPRVTSGTSCGTSTSSFTSVNGNVAEDCTNIKAGSFTICYQNWDTVSHKYIGPDDEISIMLAHWCNAGNNTDPSQPSTWPVAGNDTITQRFVIWTTLEGTSQPLCLDNFAGSFN